jgi:L,D-peptidoglycan transpeptidase YkuD (ErfK/YbiS/YcfS/YnhG family)
MFALSATPASGEPPAEQLIRVSAASRDAQTAELTAWERRGSELTRVFGPVEADLGENGIGLSTDDSFVTPEGTFPLTQAFGRQPDPGTRLPYFVATDEDWWQEDVNHPETYNTHLHGETIESDDAENLYDSGPIYDYAVLINHNPQRTTDLSAGIFLHASENKPTWGCVAIDRDTLRSILQWLDPAANPQIQIGVNLA